MSSKKRALLIGSPYGGLLGPLRDVNRMASVLQKHGFEIAECCDSMATRVCVLKAWSSFNSNSSPDDTLVIYYSGHGGILESPLRVNASLERPEDDRPWRYQFVVPVDFSQSTKDDFKGILDVELSYMLRESTNHTKNVTIIFDCCHSGRMSRDPSYGNSASPRCLFFFPST